METTASLFVACCTLSLILTPNKAAAAIIASETFDATNPSGGTYDNGTIASTSAPANRAVVVGNVGFTATAKVWRNVTSSVFISSSSGLSGSVVSGSIAGAVVLNTQASAARNSYRLLASSPALASSYYLSGLVNVGDLADLDTSGEWVANGFIGATSLTADEMNISSGFSYGVRNDAGTLYLAAFAGGNIYNLFALDGATVSNTYQIVLRLDVSDTGTDSLTAWYAENNATTLSLGLATTAVETWSSIDSLQNYAFQVNATGSGGSNSIVFDEMRFGTVLGDVTNAAIPEPSTTAMLMGGCLVAFAFRRRLAA